MKKIFKFLVFILLIGGWALAALSLHVIRTPQKVIVVPKNRLHYEGTYVDTRDWTPDDVKNHEALVERLVATGKTTQAQAVTYLTTPATQPVAPGVVPPAPPPHAPVVEEPTPPTTRSVLFD